MRRFPFDAAIVFADILLIPQALGQEVWFEAGEGPRLGALPEIAALAGEIEASTGRLASIGETLTRVRAALEPERALIGFAGAPWTVATYMIEGRGSDRSGARSFAYAQPEVLDQILEILSDATARYLVMQARSGAQVLKLFESWAEGLAEDVFERVVIRPHQDIIRRVRAAGVDAQPHDLAAVTANRQTGINLVEAIENTEKAILGQAHETAAVSMTWDYRSRDGRTSAARS